MTLPVPKSVDGVVVATVYDDRMTPMAERLLFRQPATQNQRADRAGSQRLCSGRQGDAPRQDDRRSRQALAAMVGLTVTDSSVLEMIEKREQAPRLPVMVLLENEVKDLADAHVYLDESNPKAPLATDLLLGTQGWRRFATAGTGSLNGVRHRWEPCRHSGRHRPRNKHRNRRGSHNGNEREWRLRVLQYQSRRIPDEYIAARFRNNDRTNRRCPSTVPCGRILNSTVAYGECRDDGRSCCGGRRERRLSWSCLPGARRRCREPSTALPLNDKDASIASRFSRNPSIWTMQAQEPAGPGFGIARAKVARDQAFLRANIATVREYAHTLRPNWTEGSRSDFAETVYWNAGVKTDASGLATVSFNLSDSVTSFRVLADAFAPDGTLGSNISEIESVQPFSIEPKIPLQVTSGDVIQLPIAMVNGMSRELRCCGGHRQWSGRHQVDAERRESADASG